MMTNPLVAKLRNFTRLSDEDEADLRELSTDIRFYKARQDIIEEGDRPDAVFLLVEGWAYRYKILSNGNRQIMAYLVPGDLCDVNVFILKQMDHSIGLLCDAKVVSIPSKRILWLLEKRPTITRALWWATLTDEAVLREWLVNIGQRTAFERVAHLLVEMWLRVRMVGLAEDQTFRMPVTQAELGDTLGLTSVHINRMLQALRSQGLVDLTRGVVRILDAPRLVTVSGFQPNYLHLDIGAADSER